MIKLRLKRFGKKREASFRLVACNSTSRRDGRPLQELGFYNPRTKETRLDTEAIRERLGQGAQPTDIVRTLLERGGLIEKTVRPSVTVGQANKRQSVRRLQNRLQRMQQRPRQLLLLKLRHQLPMLKRRKADHLSTR